MKNVRFEEEYYSDEYATTTYYFVAPTEMLDKYGIEHEGAVCASIALEFPYNRIEPGNASVTMSPTREDDGILEDYDWHDVAMPYEDVEKLLNIVPLVRKSDL